MRARRLRTSRVSGTLPPVCLARLSVPGCQLPAPGSWSPSLPVSRLAASAAGSVSSPQLPARLSALSCKFRSPCLPGAGLAQGSLPAPPSQTQPRTAYSCGAGRRAGRRRCQVLPGPERPVGPHGRQPATPRLEPAGPRLPASRQPFTLPARPSGPLLRSARPTHRRKGSPPPRRKDTWGPRGAGAGRRRAPGFSRVG